MTLRDKVIEKLEWIGQELTKYWYVDLTIASVGVIIYLMAQWLKNRNKT